MGPPMDEERIQRMMADPNVQQSMNEALNNPDFVNMLIQSNPMLRNMPNAREIITSPFMRSMMSNPQMMGQAMRMQRNMRGGDAAFPAPGATNTTPEGAATTGASGDNNAQGQQNPPLNPFMMPGMMGGQQGESGQQPDMAQMLQQLQSLSAMGLGDPFGAGFGAGQNAAGTTPGQGAAGEQGAQGGAQNQGASQGTTNAPPANPFAALFGSPGAQGGLPYGFTPEMMAQLLGGGAPAAPADNRPPEERYEEQLRQLNDMGFFDFDDNVAALRRSGGSVQGAVEYLLTRSSGA